MNPKIKILIRLILLAVFTFLASAFFIFKDLPSISAIGEHLNTPSIRITDRNGFPLYEILPDEGGRHAVLSIEGIPLCMQQAAIAIEDRNFYRHPGVDIEGILRALWINLRGGDILVGGSTITQQVTRNLLLPDELSQRTLRRKLRESLLAWQLTNQLSKDDILALYLNQTYYGGLAYGIEAASQTYFGKPAADLLLSECALLAGLPQAPSGYNPFTNPAGAKQRQLVVLGLMEKAGYITAEERALADQVPLSYNPAPYPIKAPHFIWMVQTRLDQLAAEGLIDLNASLVVRTTLDLDYQEHAESIIARQLETYRVDSAPLSQNVNNAALVALNPHNGEILALVGSAGFFNAHIHGAVNMAIIPRQPGSSFKPFIYAAALDPNQPPPWTAATTILDVSTTFETQDGAPYTPKNYDFLEHGPVTLREALGSSLNIPAVLALEAAGIESVSQLAGRLGITSLDNPNDYDLSLALGGGPMSLLELTTAYSAFANQGRFTGHSIILEVQDAQGALLYQGSHHPTEQVLDPRVAWLISDILSDDQARIIGFGLNSTLKLDRPAAVKTGTSDNYHDNWTIGYTPDLVTGVWVGNSNYEAMRNVSGLTGAAPIWHNFMRAILVNRPKQPFLPPPGMVQTEVCSLSGLLPTEHCQHTYKEWFIADTLPTEPDSIYQEIWIDSAVGRLATENTPEYRRQSIIVLDLPIEAIPWARAQRLPLLADYVQEEVDDQHPPLALLSPRPGATFRLSPAFDPSAQQIEVAAVAGGTFSQVTIYVDDVVLAAFSQPPYQVWWPLQIGEHRFWVEGITPDGQTFTSEIIQIYVISD